MKFFVAAVVILAIAGSTVAIDCSLLVCLSIYQPVCGSNGLTYDNKCELDIAMCWNSNITFAHNGSCDSIKKRSVDDICHPNMLNGCQRDYNPVCGSNGKTYPNKCTLCVAKYNEDQELTFKHEGPCQQIRSKRLNNATDCSELVCGSSYNPVCGSDGTTYQNECELEIAMCWNGNITYAHNGSCDWIKKRSVEDICHPSMLNGCQRDYNPVCGSNGKTYPNKCTLCVAKYIENLELTLAHQGPCQEVRSNPLNPGCTRDVLKLHCTEDDFPLCGTNKKTYGNTCKYCKELYRLEDIGFKLDVLHIGSCTPDEYCMSSSRKGVCPLNYSPVCASNGITYPNLCSMCAEMYRVRKTYPDFTLKEVHAGKCNDKSE